MLDKIKNVRSPLFSGIQPDELEGMLGCITYRIVSFSKGENIFLEEEQVRHVGVILSGTVDMIKEDLWGNKTLLVRMRKDELFGETFACGSDAQAVVTFTAVEDTEIMFMPFHKIMHSCSRTCVFHQQIIENMVRTIADKNRELMRKVEVVSKKTLREKVLTYLSLQAQINGTRYFDLPLSRVELAEYLCADRSALSRELSNMRAEGLIDFDRNTFRIF